MQRTSPLAISAILLLGLDSVRHWVGVLGRRGRGGGMPQAYVVVLAIDGEKLLLVGYVLPKMRRILLKFQCQAES